jgi:predicted anti-sigma-YlaC factor YlaD
MTRSTGDSSRTDDPFKTYDGAYVLGALSPEDRAAYEQHLRECPQCARSVQDLAGLPGLLSQVTPDMVAVESPPEELLPSVLNRARRSRRRRILAVVGAAAAAAAACVAAIAVLMPAATDPDSETSGGTAMTPLGEFPVQASAQLGDAPGGSEVDMTCSYRGATKVGDYVLVAVQQNGGTEQLATWHAIPDYTARISVGTALHRGDIQALEVRSSTGKPLLRWNPGK